MTKILFSLISQSNPNAYDTPIQVALPSFNSNSHTKKHTHTHTYAHTHTHTQKIDTNTRARTHTHTHTKAEDMPTSRRSLLPDSAQAHPTRTHTLHHLLQPQQHLLLRLPEQEEEEKEEDGLSAQKGEGEQAES
jgi:hypothetical protein